jgi:hypothetical protein
MRPGPGSFGFRGRAASASVDKLAYRLIQQ